MSIGTKNTTNMRILMLNYEYPPLGGGAGNACSHLLREFLKVKYLEIDLVTSSIDKYKEESFNDKIKIFYLDIGKKGSLHHQSLKDLLIYSWRAYFFARKLIRWNKYDLTHAFFGIPSGFIVMFLKLPYIVSLRGSDVPFYSRRFRFLDRLIFKNLSRIIWGRAKKVIANSSYLFNLALRTNHNQEIKIIPNGVDIDYFYPTPLRREQPLSQAFIIISTSRLIKRKGIEQLIEAFAKLKKSHPASKLIMAGDGDLRDKLFEAARGIPGIEFLGNQPKDKLAELYRAADVFVLPSEAEGMSNSLLEAMASGLGVVLSRAAAPAELIGPENAIVLERNDSDSICTALLELARRLEFLREMKAANHRKAIEFSWQNTAREYLKIYAENNPIKNK